MPARPVRRPDLRRDDEGEPAPPLVRLHGLCPALRLAPDRSPTHPVRHRHLRYDPPAAVEDRGLGAQQLPAHQARHDLGLPLAAGVRAGPSSARSGHLLKDQAYAALGRSPAATGEFGPSISPMAQFRPPTARTQAAAAKSASSKTLR